MRALERSVAFTRGWPFVAIVTALFVCAGLAWVRADAFVEDEGLLSHQLAELLACDPLAATFFLKVKPVSAAVHLPAVLLGLDVFYVWHVLIGAACIPLTAMAARRLGLAEPGVPVVVVALSPLLLAGSPSGITNVDGVVFGLVGLVLVLSRMPLAAGLVAGALPLARFEMSLMSLLIAAIALTRERPWRFVVGAPVVPASYLAAGAVYHGNLLWFLEYPPVWGDLAAPGMEVIATTAGSLTPGMFAAALAHVSLAIAAIPLLRVGSLPVAERLMIAYLVGYTTAITLPAEAHYSFGFTERYYLGVLPAAALLAGRLAEERVSRARIVVPAVLAVLLYWTGPHAITGSVEGVSWPWRLAVVGFLLAVPAMPFVAPATRVAILAVGLAAFVPCALPSLSIARLRNEPRVDVAADWLARHPGATGGKTAYTNVRTLGARVRHIDSPGSLDVRRLLQPDSLVEVTSWTNGTNGQREAMLACMRSSRYGSTEEPSILLDGTAPPGTLVILDSGNPPVLAALPPDFVETRLTVLDREGPLVFGRLNPPGP
jgi:hypothetical protein